MLAPVHALRIGRVTKLTRTAHFIGTNSGFDYSNVLEEVPSNSFDGPAFTPRTKASSSKSTKASSKGHEGAPSSTSDTPTSSKRPYKGSTKPKKGKDTERCDGRPVEREVSSGSFLSPTPSQQAEIWKEREKRTKPPAKPRRAASKLQYTRKIEGLLKPLSKPVLEDLEPITKHKPVATLAHGLDRVLFNPGVHWMQDSRSQVYNFTTYLENIPRVEEFAFEKLPGFIKSSRDEDLWELAERRKRTFAGSTSSLSGILSHCYFLISEDRQVDTRNLSAAFKDEQRGFTPGQRAPKSVCFNYQKGVYAVDSAGDAPGVAERNILTWMGTLLEKFLTSPPQEFASFMRKVSTSDKEVKDDGLREAYRYSESKDFVMRSQLDCQDRRLPGTGVFDIKTRAALPIRLDLMNHEENSGYLIRTQQGLLESFEKEYYDLIRSAFLKYSFQVRIGDMDGVLVAYHNTAKMFGFQYVPLEEMEERLYGHKDRGAQVFEKCVGLMEAVADEVIKCFPGQSLLCTFETLYDTKKMRVWVQPAEWNGPEDEWPIEQLDVTVVNFLGDKEIPGPKVIGAHAEPDAEPWSLHFSIGKSSATVKDMRANLQSAKKRQFFAWSLPNDVSMGEMAHRWANTNFGKPARADGNNDELIAEDDGTFNPKRFMVPDLRIQQLRALSRQGRSDSEQREEESKGARKVIWGEPDVVENLVEGVDFVSEPESAQGEVLEEADFAEDLDAGAAAEALTTDVDNDSLTREHADAPAAADSEETTTPNSSSDEPKSL